MTAILQNRDIPSISVIHKCLSGISLILIQRFKSTVFKQEVQK